MKRKKLHRITSNSKAVSDLINEWKNEVKIGERCPICGENMILTFQNHHIDGNHHNNSKKNKVPICASCHNIINKAKETKETKKAWIERHNKWTDTRKIHRKAAKSHWRNRRKH